MKILLNKKSLSSSLRHFNDIGFVPTMGSIHRGHLSLIKQSKKNCKKTVVSIFVNPKQFNNKNDFINYPSNIKRDLKILKKSCSCAALRGEGPGPGIPPQGGQARAKG